jgi:hypothetical protein
MRKEGMFRQKRSKTMLNIFADALLIASRLGRLPEPPQTGRRRSPREFEDIEGLRTADHLRMQGR